MLKALFLASFLCICGGCTAAFTGEWVEDGTAGPNGKTISPTGERRMALSFDPVSGVRYGRYNEDVGVVDNVTVQSGEYFVMDGWNKGQFGSMIAKVDGEHMQAGITGGPQRKFTRVHGPSIFPPFVELPSFTEK